MNRSKLLMLSSFAAFLLAACSSTPTSAPTVASNPAPVSAPAPAAPAASQPASAPPAPAAAVPAKPLPAHLDPKSAISTNRSVYFGYDDYAIRSEYGPLIERHGKYLASNPSLSIKIEGNADERGGAEYNLALGQKRAEVVRRALKLYGVNESQMEAISWGKEKPTAPGHGEAAWAQNRRADLVYPDR